LTVTFDNWRVGASNVASCTFTYSFTKTGGSALNLGTPAFNVVLLSQDIIQDDGTAFYITINGELYDSGLISKGTVQYIFPVTIKSPC
jgi:hypothetical protein